ncbi:hypothetical protein TASCI_20161 [Tenacibaculum ascidiaceicola]
MCIKSSEIKINPQITKTKFLNLPKQQFSTFGMVVVKYMKCYELIVSVKKSKFIIHNQLNKKEK